MNTEQDLSGEDTEETLHPNENYDSGTEQKHRADTAAVRGVDVSDKHV